MLYCAQRKQGLLIVLARNYRVGDVGFLWYRWTQAQKIRYLRTGAPPRVGHALSAETAIVPISYYVRQRESRFRGPCVTPAQFHRLSSTAQHRLVLWNTGSIDTKH